jgi:hypothetical protein
MQAFDPTILGWRLADDEISLIPDGWDADDTSIMIAQFVPCEACRGVVSNIREHKAAHVAWHGQIQPDADIT